ncbi:solute carrier family 7 member 13 isoform X2 [Hemicordylus capensis]|uniref:solute carrier family 7 member 13 isoform X2 n=1 Tax=Hemicordylus capensis TaxID=884348 RepID=UPI0023036488|nr:solute carrier family 7 member 13 isoform X2 [Hemicordylus capensis]
MRKEKCAQVKEPNESENGQMKLQRTIGYFEGVSFIIGTIVGAGIFISPTGVLKYSLLNVGVALIIWTACGIISLMGALCYAELGTALPFSGGEYSHIKRALGSPLAFVFMWTAMFNKPASNAARALLFAEYATQPFYGECLPPELLKKCLALAVLWCLGILNARSVKMAAWLQTVFTVLKMLALSVIAIGGIALLIRGRKENTARFEHAFSSEIPDAVQIAEAFFQGLYAYGGWWNLNYMAEEMKNPSRNIPWTVMTALPLVTVFYLLVNVSYLTVLTPKEIVSSDLIALTNFFGFSIWLMIGLTCASLIVLRYREPNLHRPYKVFLPVAFGMVAIALFLVLAPVIWSPTVQYIYASLFMLAGLPLYLPLVHFKIHFQFIDKITCYLQLLLQVSPANDKSE